MRLLCSEYGIDLEIRENKVNVLVIESPNIFSLMINELICQMGGEPGRFILSEQDVVKNIAKEIEIIVNPFVIDCNERRIQQKLYQELVDEMNEAMVEDTTHLQREIISYFEKVIKRVPYPLDFDVEENMTALLKLYHVAIDVQSEVLVVRIMNYIKVLKQFCNIRFIFFCEFEIISIKT